MSEIDVLVFPVSGDSADVVIKMINRAQIVRELQQIVGGRVEQAFSVDNINFLCNEDGVLHDLPCNNFFSEFRGTIVAVRENSSNGAVLPLAIKPENLTKFIAEVVEWYGDS
jgi:hypothetical protein